MPVLQIQWFLPPSQMNGPRPLQPSNFGLGILWAHFRALSNLEERGSKRLAFQELSGSLSSLLWTQGSHFVSGSMSVEGSAAMGGVRPRAPRGAPNQAVSRHARTEGCVSGLSSVCVSQGQRAKPARSQLPRTPCRQCLEGRTLAPRGSLLSQQQSVPQPRRQTPYQGSVQWPR